eukprot:m.78422 g.78422  ORF g.78422 m.78422 type:complete len:675 (-) comp8576_c4_seq1:325-2349(-)
MPPRRSKRLQAKKNTLKKKESVHQYTIPKKHTREELEIEKKKAERATRKGRGLRRANTYFEYEGHPETRETVDNPFHKLMGTEIELFFNDSKKWKKGQVVEFHAFDGLHLIQFEDNTKKFFNLNKKRYRLAKGGSEEASKKAKMSVKKEDEEEEEEEEYDGWRRWQTTKTRKRKAGHKQSQLSNTEPVRGSDSIFSDDEKDAEVGEDIVLLQESSFFLGVIRALVFAPWSLFNFMMVFARSLDDFLTFILQHCVLFLVNRLLAVFSRTWSFLAVAIVTTALVSSTFISSIHDYNESIEIETILVSNPNIAQESDSYSTQTTKESSPPLALSSTIPVLTPTSQSESSTSSQRHSISHLSIPVENKDHSDALNSLKTPVAQLDKETQTWNVASASSIDNAHQSSIQQISSFGSSTSDIKSLSAFLLEQLHRVDDELAILENENKPSLFELRRLMQSSYETIISAVGDDGEQHLQSSIMLSNSIKNEVEDAMCGTSFEHVSEFSARYVSTECFEVESIGFDVVLSPSKWLELVNRVMVDNGDSSFINESPQAALTTDDSYWIIHGLSGSALFEFDKTVTLTSLVVSHNTAKSKKRMQCAPKYIEVFAVNPNTQSSIFLMKGELNHLESQLTLRVSDHNPTSQLYPTRFVRVNVASNHGDPTRICVHHIRFVGGVSDV